MTHNNCTSKTNSNFLKTGNNYIMIVCEGLCNAIKGKVCHVFWMFTDVLVSTLAGIKTG